jgi:ABC-type amino acid transport system permease subunit
MSRGHSRRDCRRSLAGSTSGSQHRLSYWPTTILVVLPQALRVSIPALVNTFIAFFKDTSLVIVIGLFDLLAPPRP